MVRDSSSDEDEDHQALVPQNEAKPPSQHSNLQRCGTFEIAGDLTSRISHGIRSRRWHVYLLAICLPLVLILVFFSLDLGRLFRGVSIIRAESPGNRMREAELRALYLLRYQQVGLLNLWNRTVTRSNASLPAISSQTSHNSSSVPSEDDLPQFPASISLEEFRSALLQQIKLNKRIQNALLSAHRVRNASAEIFDGHSDAYFFGSEVELCGKVDLPADRRTIEWKPKKDRFLFAICVSGQMSNHLICLEKHMLFAALLGRVLVFPSHKLDYDYNQVLDISHINECLGREVVISYDNFVAKMKNKLKIDRFICYIASPPCYLDQEFIKRLKSLGITLGKIEAAWPGDAKLKVQKKRVVSDIAPKFSSDDEVIAIGDMFYADVEEEWLMQPGGPIAHNCKALVQPSRLILLTAQRFVQTFLGGNFIALHFRRHGFLKFCNAKKESFFYPIPQAAGCILESSAFQFPSNLSIN
ncbi:hypothetical protein HPP92_013771 [Vanilla planifolia]|uniref:O-fucosyltransferase family protein n=1 Tax=Vanilla planifolia TaxID=51239 RepID=A0A835R455_VANPL|nr:hypothetical protein HPP92_026494 [Vanilla planifolia]KAG0479052.1 hypothetical protein HPP92_013771 [Vanilla planifolia]